MRQLRRLGPRPLLILRTVAHAVWRRLADRVLRREYARLVATPRGRAILDVTSLDLPPADALPEELRADAERIRAEADAVLRHEVDFLGSGPTRLGERIDWHTDFKSGFRWPPGFYQSVTVTRLDDESDAKVPWELSRGHHLLTLARADALFGDTRYRDELERELLDWIEANPPGFGINWVNPMEVAIRAVNWIWCVRTAEARAPLSPALRERLTRSLEAHGRHVRANLEGKPYLRSNHHLADLVGLLSIGWALRAERFGRRWLSFAHRQLEREMAYQVHPDGVDFEASLPYHGLVLELFLVAAAVAREAGRPFSRAFDERLARMLEVSRTVRLPGGRIPQIGDGDSGRILPGGFARGPSQDHLLWLGAALMGEHAPLPGPPDAEVAWTLGLSAWGRAAALPAAPAPGSEAFRDGGLYVLAGEGVRAVVRCGDVGQGGNGGHAHNDLLSYELAYAEPLVVDSGTYAYTSDPAARNELRSTRAHSTVTVADAEINPIDPQALFRMEQVAAPVLHEWRAGAASTRVVVSHDGYLRLDPGVVHLRTFELDHATGTLAVRDELRGEGRQRAESFVHLAGDVTVEPSGAAHGYRLGQASGSVELEFEGVAKVSAEEGWVSSAFGTRGRAPVLRAEIEGELPLRFGYMFTPRSA